jgi:amidase
MKGSAIGVGTDIAGSIRIPAYVNGVLGLRPTTRRVPYGGQKGPSRPGAPGILAVAGPLARSVRDIDAFMSAVLNYDTWTVDETAISLPWQKPKTPKDKKLKLGYIMEDPHYYLHPTVLRAMKTAISKLEAAGHTLIDLSPQLPEGTLYDAMVISFKQFAMDPKQTSFLHINASGEPVIPSIPTTVLPDLKDFTPSVDEVYDLNVGRAKIQQIFRKIWTENGLDGFLVPTYQATGVPHDRYGTPIYTTLLNLLDVSNSSFYLGFWWMGYDD